MSKAAEAAPHVRFPLAIAGTKVWVTHEVVPISSIRLNPDNPRVRFLIERQSGKKKLSQGELIDVIRDQPHYAPLQKAIRKAGGIFEPVIVSHDGLVVEGNTRLAVFATLSQPKETGANWKTIPILRLPKDVAEHALGILMASYHVGGKAVWRPYAQADHIYRLHTIYNRSIEEISDATSMAKGKVEQYLDAYKYLVNEVLPHAETGQEREVLEKRFHHALEFVTRKNLAELRENPEVRQDLAKLLVENKIKGQEVRQLDKVLKHRKASSALKKSGFDAAKSVLRESDPVAASKLFKDIQSMSRAIGKMDSEDIDLLKSSKKARELLEELSEAIQGAAAVAGIEL